MLPLVLLLDEAHVVVGVVVVDVRGWHGCGLCWLKVLLLVLCWRRCVCC